MMSLLKSRSFCGRIATGSWFAWRYVSPYASVEYSQDAGKVTPPFQYGVGLAVDLMYPARAYG